MKLYLIICSFFCLSCSTFAQMAFQKETQDKRQVILADFLGQNQKVVSDPNLDTYHPDLSSSGQFLAFSQGKILQGGNTQLEIVVKDFKNNLTEIWSPKGNQYIHVEFSGNERFLAFSGPNPKNNKQNIYIVDLDKERKRGPKKTETVNGQLIKTYQPQFEVIESEYDCYAPAVSSDGSEIIYHRTMDRNNKQAPKQLVSYNRLTKTEFEITEKGDHAMFPSLSSDDRFVVYVSQDSGQWDIYTFDLWTKNIKQLTKDADMEFTPSFRDNNEIYFTRFVQDSNDEYKIDIYYLPKESLNSKTLIAPIPFLSNPSVAEYVPSFSNSSALTQKDLPYFPSPERSSFGSITHLNKVYIAGGHQGPEHSYPKESFLNTLQAYDLKTKTWETLAPMNEAKHGFQMAAYGDFIYVFGGFTYSDAHKPRWKSVNTIERYSVSKNRWEILKVELPRKRSSNALAIVQDVVYLIGGWDSTPQFENDKNGKFHPEIDTFDLTNESVETLTDTSLSPLRRALTAVTVKDEIYLLGGIGEGSSHFEWIDNLTRFNTKTKIWTELKSLPFATFAPGSGVLKDKIYLIGGMVLKDKKNFDIDYVDDIYKFNPEDNTWVHTGVYLNQNKGFPQVVELDTNSIGILGGHTYVYSSKGVIDHPVNHFETLSEKNN